MALSAGDRRRQRALAAGDHLLACETCASLSEPLLQRERALAGWWPIVLIPPGARLAFRAMKEHPAQTAASATVVAGVAGGAVFLAADREAPPAPVAVTTTSAPSTTAAPEPGAAIEVGGTRVPLRSGADLRPFAGQVVNVRRASVLAVDADEGFWVGPNAEQRLWVRLLDTGTESPPAVQPGLRVTFDGLLVAHPVGFAASVGLDAAEGAEALDAQGHHIEVASGDLRLEPA
ncbi:MAG: hypothetical protein H0U89_09515 [Acidimicrobiia bacterium]|nr:hypothetical protein [Acidimicrobiia bacterium]